MDKQKIVYDCFTLSMTNPLKQLLVLHSRIYLPVESYIILPETNLQIIVQVREGTDSTRLAQLLDHLPTHILTSRLLDINNYR